MRPLAALFGLALVALGSSTRALADIAERPHDWDVELGFSPVYYPDVDQTAGVQDIGYTGSSGAPRSGTPFYDIYGPKHRLLTQVEVDRDLWQAFGEASVGVSLGYAEFYGHGLSANTGQKVDALSSFHVLPLKLLGTYRFDPFVPRGIPLVPFVRGGLDWVIYWNAMESGQISFVPGATGTEALGLTTGIEGTIGVALVLDWIDPVLARDFSADMGIERTSFIVAYTDELIENGPGNVIHAIRTGGAAPTPVIDLSARYFEFGIDFQF
ncbi:MAG: MXAN_2562 family outer membrane beta-barrel protein [Deltaproteobacteria bacterium]